MLIYQISYVKRKNHYKKLNMNIQKGGTEYEFLCQSPVASTWQTFSMNSLENYQYIVLAMRIQSNIVLFNPLCIPKKFLERFINVNIPI